MLGALTEEMGRCPRKMAKKPQQKPSHLGGEKWGQTSVFAADLGRVEDEAERATKREDRNAIFRRGE
jgi:hypothetical protein